MFALSNEQVMLLDTLVSRCLDLESDVTVYVDDFTDSIGEITAYFDDNEIWWTIIDETPIADYDTLVNSLDRSCHFPAWSQLNWNAIQENLCDFEWADATGYMLIFRDPLPLQQQDPETWEEFVSVLKSANRSWRGYGKPFKLLVPSYSVG